MMVVHAVNHLMCAVLGSKVYGTERMVDDG